MVALSHEVITAIGISVLMLVMVVSGCALMFKSLAPARLATIKSPAMYRVLTVLEFLAIIIFVPGTITIYAAYIRLLATKN
ncbi:minor membrane component of the virion [Squirrelpox virus]|uniref:Minor membrane component of the virion n=1 Tax=Squirrelpox virus TaxID=240426 RepID=U3UBC5_9POXV|nr:minor membrane component of the virion [Squirrelpox virus]CCD83223.1 minor membrane component of the virion [Squirrelpox virus]